MIFGANKMYKINVSLTIARAQSPALYHLNKSPPILCAKLSLVTPASSLEVGTSDATLDEERTWLLCELGEAETAVDFLFYCLAYEDKDVLYSKTSSTLYGYL